MKKLLVGLMVVGNFVVWGLAYVGYSQNADSKSKTYNAHSVQSSQPQAADVTLGYFNVVFDGAEKRQPLYVSIKLADSRDFKKLCRVKPQLQRNFYKIINLYPPRVVASQQVEFGRLNLRLVAEANKLVGKNTVAIAKLAQDQLLTAPNEIGGAEREQAEILEFKNCPEIEVTQR